MGEAVYYMRIRFPKNSLKKKLPEIQAFFREGFRAENWWQENRGQDNEPFWKTFEKKFPKVSDYLKTQCPEVWGKDNNNGLAGKLDFCCEESDIDHMSYEKKPGGDELLYSAMVWHMADWSPLTAYVRKKWGGLKEAWQSDEDTGSSLYPELEDHEQIVNDLLEQSQETLIPLMNINDDLDALISEKLKKTPKV